jgi:hypothetical protein
MCARERFLVVVVGIVVVLLFFLAAVLGLRCLLGCSGIGEAAAELLLL